MKNLFMVSAIIEVIGIMAIACGLGIEAALQAEVGYMLITGGALGVAAGSLLFSKVIRRK